MAASAVRFEGAAQTFLDWRSMDMGNTRQLNAHIEMIYRKQNMCYCFYLISNYNVTTEIREFRMPSVDHGGLRSS